MLALAHLKNDFFLQNCIIKVYKEEQGSLFFYLQDNMTAASMCALKQSQLV